MHSTRLIHLMMAALSVTAVTGVAWLDNQHAGAGQLAVRADKPEDLISLGPALNAESTTDAPAADPTTSSGDAANDSVTSAPPAETTSDTPTTSNTPTPTPTTSDGPAPTPTTSDSPIPTTTEATTGGTTVTTPPATTTRANPSSAAPTPSSTSSGGSSGDDTTEVPQTTPPPVTSTFITVITSTDAAGQTHVSSSSSVIVSTPSPVADTSGNKESGMSPQVRNTIIGVCVGVGGAIVLAAAGVLFWRLRNNRRSLEENEELVSYGDGFGGPGTAEKSEPSGSTAGRSPFQSTLESYHAPAQANAASNF
ncbi:hypothetical protein F4813DRAFT_355917 [Daldinia decipiens]|uniref:uncharacterized protein n=1 Tax=Daldinia decipiens TaxID=326647 RepID=UPI0020C389CA|nr:uncharacterized protein F4813DRAFT_355917 [Daldinia decipiens]KAI1658666.1 hypothetical protein F4813DRAFT_355917 [Daldinia decipiens]